MTCAHSCAWRSSVPIIKLEHHATGVDVDLSNGDLSSATQDGATDKMMQLALQRCRTSRSARVRCIGSEATLPVLPHTVPSPSLRGVVPPARATGAHVSVLGACTCVRVCVWVHVCARARAHVACASVFVCVRVRARLARSVRDFATACARSHDSASDCGFALGLPVGRPAFRCMALFLKLYLAEHRLDQVYHGGLGSFKTYMMVLHRLQTNLGISDTADPGKALIDFFQFYGNEFDFASEICVEEVKTNFESVKLVDEIKRLFREAAAGLAAGNGLDTLITFGRLWTARESSMTKAAAFVNGAAKALPAAPSAAAPTPLPVAPAVPPVAPNLPATVGQKRSHDFAEWTIPAGIRISTEAE